MRLLSRTIVREIFVSATLGAVLFTFVLFLQRARPLFEFLVRNTGPAKTVAYLFALVLPQALPFTIPLGVLVATLITLSRMSSDGEITAMRAAGVPATKSATSIDVIGDQCLWDRELYRFVSDHREGQRPILGPSWRLARAPARIARGAPDLGEDTDHVLHDILRAGSSAGGRT